MSATPRHATYIFKDTEEQLLTIGPADAAARILLIPPFFDEMNRVRHTIIETMRALAQHSVASALPDLPGCNESLAKLEEQSLSHWREAVAIAAQECGATHIFSVRGGCLIDTGPALPTQRLSPVKGKSLLKTLIRTRIAGDKESGLSTTAEKLSKQAQVGKVELAGHQFGMTLWNELENAEPDSSGNKIQEIKLPDISGSPLWLRAEPQHDAAMAEALAVNLAHWAKAESAI